MPVTLVELEGDDEVLAEGDALRLIAALGEADGDPLPDKLAAALAVTLTLNDSEGDGDEEPAAPVAAASEVDVLAGI